MKIAAKSRMRAVGWVCLALAAGCAPTLLTLPQKGSPLSPQSAESPAAGPLLQSAGDPLLLASDGAGSDAVGPAPLLPPAPALRSQPPPAGFRCVMHSEVHSDRPGRCPQCGMQLVATEAEKGVGQ